MKQTRKEGQLLALQKEVTRLRKEVDMLGLQRSLDELLLRVSRLEILQGDKPH